MTIERFFEYAKKRYKLMLDKEADFERPWTDDPILQQYRFCNVFREDDKVTKWIRSNITHEGYGDKLVGAMVIARWFNRIETLEHLLPLPHHPGEENLFYSWSQDFEKWLADMKARLSHLSPLVTGAYMIKTPAKMNKLEGILWCLDHFLPDAVELYYSIVAEPEATLQHTTEHLATYPYLGPFMAYEVVTDLRHSILQDAPDIMTWANPGPGCARGLDRVLEQPLGTFNRHRPAHVSEMMTHMQRLLKASGKAKYWPQHWPRWEMRDVEHTLCELDKYERARLGEGKPKQKYKPAA